MSDLPDPADSRLQAGLAWARAAGVAIADVSIASADASFRRYFRLHLDTPYADQPTLILMDAPPDKEDTHAFVRIGRGLRAAGLPVPEIHVDDADRGYALLTDLGDRSLLALLRAEPHLAGALYQQAGDYLHRLQEPDNGVVTILPAYDAERLQTEMQLFSDWLCGTHLQLDWSSDDHREWRRLTERLTQSALQQPVVAVHRDYHSRNLMVDAAGRLSIIDFQDAMCGPLTYDLVSLLRDCYYRWPLVDVERWAGAWFDNSVHARHYDRQQYLRWFFLMGVQRHLKAAGIFARLGHRDGKWGYLDDVPRTLGYIVEIAPSYPELAWLSALISERCLPVLDAA